MTSNFEPKFEPGQFLRRRLVRIYPSYWITACLYLGYHTVVGSPYSLSATEAVGALLLIPGTAGQIIGPAWTLAYEMFFYVCFASTMWLGLNRGFIALVTGFVALIALGAIMRPESAFLDVVTNPLLLEFLAGMCIGWLVKTGRLPLSLGTPAMAIGLALFVVGIWFGYKRLPTVVMWGVPSTLLVAGIVAAEIRKGSAAAVRLVGHLGDSSYSLYLFHILILTVLVDAYGALGAFAMPNAILASVAATIVCIACSEGFYRTLEQPVLRSLNGKRRPAAQSGQMLPSSKA
jgi:exopolysaccharide production protein ExoZ